MNGRTRISLIAAALGASALLVTGGSASATNTINTPSKISIKSSGLDFVISSKVRAVLKRVPGDVGRNFLSAMPYA